MLLGPEEGVRNRFGMYVKGETNWLDAGSSEGVREKEESRMPPGFGA